MSLEAPQYVAGRIEYKELTEDDRKQLRDLDKLPFEDREVLLLKYLRQIITENLGLGVLRRIYRATPDRWDASSPIHTISMPPELDTESQKRVLGLINELHSDQEKRIATYHVPMVNLDTLEVNYPPFPDPWRETERGENPEMNPDNLRYVILALKAGYEVTVQFDQHDAKSPETILWYWGTTAGELETYLYTESVDLTKGIPIFDKDGIVVNWAAPRGGGKKLRNYDDPSEPDWRMPSEHLVWSQLTWDEQAEWSQLTSPHSHRRHEVEEAINVRDEVRQESTLWNTFEKSTKVTNWIDFVPTSIELFKPIVRGVQSMRTISTYQNDVELFIRKMKSKYNKNSAMLHSFPDYPSASDYR